MWETSTRKTQKVGGKAFKTKKWNENGYEITPVNPNADVILKKQCYDEITDVPNDVDIVDVFRPSDQV